MMTMLEKAARAAYDGYEFKQRDDMGGCLRFDDLAGFQKDNWRSIVRAVLMAIKEPDETLSRATQSTEGWEAMIDAILNEKPEGLSDV